MKKLLITTLLIIGSISIYAQNKQEQDKHYVYAQMYKQGGIKVNYGTEAGDELYRTKDDKKVINLTAGLNNMAADGWEVVSSHEIAGLEVYTLRKEVTAEEQKEIAEKGRK